MRDVLFASASLEQRSADVEDHFMTDDEDQENIKKHFGNLPSQLLPYLSDPKSSGGFPFDAIITEAEMECTPDDTHTTTVVHFTSFGNLHSLKTGDVCKINGYGWANSIHCHTCLNLQSWHWNIQSEYNGRITLAPLLKKELHKKDFYDDKNEDEELIVTGISKQFVQEEKIKRGVTIPRSPLVEFKANGGYYYAWHPDTLNVGDKIHHEDLQTTKWVTLISKFGDSWNIPYHTYRVFIRLRPKDCEYEGDHDVDRDNMLVHVSIPDTKHLRFTGKIFKQERPVWTGTNSPFRGWNLLFDVCS